MATNQEVKENKKRVRVLNVPVDFVPENILSGLIETYLENEKSHQVVLLSFRDLMRARRNAQYRQCLQDASLVLPVSSLVTAGAVLLGYKNPVRYNSFDFVIKLLSILEEQKSSVFLLGQQQADLAIAEQNLRETYPGLQFFGRHHGYYKRELEPNIVLGVRKADPGLLLIGNGLKGKNLWVWKYKKELNSGIQLWSGYVFDILSHKKARPSKKLTRHGLEFLPDYFRRPWKLFGVFQILWFFTLVLIFKIFDL
jgi:N-acetylglucosaminyldiphosphoundecaprenol N-acetyl-beta-D-mannosaminyltransferase